MLSVHLAQSSLAHRTWPQLTSICASSDIPPVFENESRMDDDGDHGGGCVSTYFP